MNNLLDLILINFLTVYANIYYYLNIYDIDNNYNIFLFFFNLSL